MSLENVRAFWRKVEQEPALQEKFLEVQADGQAAAVAAVVGIAAEAGFAFTAQEYDAAVRDELVRRHATGEIPDEALAALAGGLSGGLTGSPTGGSTTSLYGGGFSSSGITHM